MKKPLLAVTAAAALTIASVISPSGAHLPTATAAEGSSAAADAAVALGTSETVDFIFRNGRWEILNYDGYTTRGNQRFGCFNGYKLNDLGAPEAFRQNAYICTLAEIGR